MAHTEITPAERADRLAIRELIDAYARCADTHDAEGQKSLFTEDTHFVVYMDGKAYGAEADALNRPVPQTGVLRPFFTRCLLCATAPAPPPNRH